MISLLPPSRRTPLSPRQIQARLLALAGLFLFFYAAALSLAPSARIHAWSADIPWQHWAGFVLWVVLFAAAHRFIQRYLPAFDPYLLPIAALLCGWGLLTIWRLLPNFGLRQSAWLFVSLTIFIAGLRLPPDLSFLRRYKYVWLTGGLLLTALTLLLGTNPAGGGNPRLWLGCCGLYFQPSEPLKLLLIVYLASYLSGEFGEQGRRAGAPGAPLLPLIAPTLIMTGLALLLLVVQRDLGTASIFIFLYTAILYVTSTHKRILLAGGAAVTLAAVAGYALFDVVRLRVDAWLNPWLDPSGRSYQIVQSLMAVANGGLVGRGPGMGSPGVVPVAHSDFIFASIAEESGLLGTVGLLLLLALFTARGLRIALAAPDLYRRFLAAGLTAHLAGQSVLIIGGNLRLLPLTGVTLPFVSYGGSSLLVCFLATLLLVHISRPTEGKILPPAFPRIYLQLGMFLLCGLFATALAAGWWAVIRAPALASRTDNPRRFIADRYVPRGSILDRHNTELVATSGEPGALTRQILYPDLSSILGYTNAAYGQSGLEANLDGILRGLQGNPGLTVFWSNLLYGQPPPGLDVRTTLDLDLQLLADTGLGERAGALVLLNATTGEILAMASHPTFNANRLEQDWTALMQDPRSPLLNRATLGQYPTGDLQAALFPQGIGAFGLNEGALLRLPEAGAPDLSQTGPALSPLQVALAAASLSGIGIRPAPIFAQAINTPQAGWAILPALAAPVNALSAARAGELRQALTREGEPVWEKTSLVQTGSGTAAAWYVGGTQPDWSGAPLAIAVLIEGGQPEEAAGIGRAVLDAAMGR